MDDGVVAERRTLAAVPRRRGPAASARGNLGRRSGASEGHEGVNKEQQSHRGEHGLSSQQVGVEERKKRTYREVKQARYFRARTASRRRGHLEEEERHAREEGQEQSKSRRKRGTRGGRRRELFLLVARPRFVVVTDEAGTVVRSKQTKRKFFGGGGGGGGGVVRAASRLRLSASF